MKIKITEVEQFFTIGCGRCDKAMTPECKVHHWQDELQRLREITLSCLLGETLKWSQPCYTFQGENVILISAFKDKCVLSFMRGSLIKDTAQILQKAGANSEIGRVVYFDDCQQIEQQRDTIVDYIQQVVELIKAGVKVERKPKQVPLPEELQARLNSDSSLNDAFQALTPGRQRSYCLHIAAAKQSKTRVARVEKCIPKIHAGLGFNEYKKM